MLAPEGITEGSADQAITRLRALGARHPAAQVLGFLLRAGDDLKTASDLSPARVSDCMDVYADLKRQHQKIQLRTRNSNPLYDLLEQTLLPIIKRIQQ